MKMWVQIATGVHPDADITSEPGTPVVLSPTLTDGTRGRVPIGEVEDVKRVGTTVYALLRVDDEAGVLPSGAFMSMTDAVSVGLRPESLRPTDV